MIIFGEKNKLFLSAEILNATETVVYEKREWGRQGRYKPKPSTTKPAQHKEETGQRKVKNRSQRQQATGNSRDYQNRLKKQRSGATNQLRPTSETRSCGEDKNKSNPNRNTEVTKKNKDTEKYWDQLFLA